MKNILISRYLKFVLFLTVILLFGTIFQMGCDESTAPNDSNGDNLFTAKFINDWLCADCGEGIIIISDTSGKYIADSTWFGNSEIKFLKSKQDSLPDRISITVLKRKPDWEERYIFIESYLNIQLGSTWTFRGEPVKDSLGTANIKFNNIPEHSEYIYSTLWSSRFVDWNQLDTLISLTLFDYPDNLYLKLKNLQNEEKYFWKSNIGDSITYQIDLANLLPLSAKNIQFPQNSYNMYINLYGRLVTGDRYNGSYLLNYIQRNDTVVTSIDLQYPPSIFSEFYTYVRFYNDFYKRKVTAIYGQIPESIENIDADFQIINTVQDSFAINTTGVFDNISTGWSQNVNANQYIMNWHVYSSSEFDSYSLPELPLSVEIAFPFIDRDEFKLFWISLHDYQEISSFNEYLSYEFNSGELFFNVINGIKYVGQLIPSTNINSYADLVSKENEINKIPIYIGK